MTLQNGTLTIILPVVGTLAGVAVAFTGQIVSGTLQRRHEWRKQFTEKRQEVYVAFQSSMRAHAETVIAFQESAAAATTGANIIEVENEAKKRQMDEFMQVMEQRFVELESIPDEDQAALESLKAEIDMFFDASTNAFNEMVAREQARVVEFENQANLANTLAVKEAAESKKLLIGLEFVASKPVLEAAARLRETFTSSGLDLQDFRAAEISFIDAVRRELGVD